MRCPVSHMALSCANILAVARLRRTDLLGGSSRRRWLKKRRRQSNALIPKSYMDTFLRDFRSTVYLHRARNSAPQVIDISPSLTKCEAHKTPVRGEAFEKCC